jgi:hypothetical protein
MRYLLTPFLLSFLLSAKVLDRIAIVVDNRVITETQLDEELHLTAFLNRQPVDTSADARRAAADRLVEQELIRREMRLSQYPPPSGDEVNELCDAQRQQSGSEALLEKALSGQRVDYALSSWLEETRKQVDIIYLDKGLE